MLLEENKHYLLQMFLTVGEVNQAVSFINYDWFFFKYFVFVAYRSARGQGRLRDIRAIYATDKASSEGNVICNVCCGLSSSRYYDF